MSIEVPRIVNVAAYRFVELSAIESLRDELHALCTQHALRGSILLSGEGINLFVAGTREDIDVLLSRLRDIPGMADLDVKESLSQTRPFNRMLVKIKQEIIAFGVAGIDPRQYTSRRVSAKQLKSWLDEGRPVTLLDARNNFEVKVGTFDNAQAIGVEDFREFPKAVSRLPDEMKQQTVVTFCTGGIRCEKAAPFLEREGFRDVYQLDGGILKYLEECGQTHFHGQCFVFDKRVAVDASLKEAGLSQCFVCWSVLTPDELGSPEYVEGKSCPNCYATYLVSPEQRLQERRDAIRDFTRVLPGSVPYENIRPISVPLRFDGYELLEFLDAMRTHLTRDDWRRACDEGRLTCRGELVQPGRKMRSGDRLLHKLPAASEPDVSANIEILYEDDELVVVDKPAPLPMHPCGRFNRNSLSYILDRVYHPLQLRPAHRLDADTTGLVLFSKSREVARHLQEQFESGGIRKTYLAHVQGHPAEDRFECHASIGSAPGPNGVRIPDPNGAAASTRFRLAEKLPDGTALLKVEPLTGRTNQIRVHLWLLDLPIVGDPIYLRGSQLGNARTLAVTDPPMCLQAAAIEFNHPASKKPILFEASSPTWSHERDGSVMPKPS